MEGFTKVPSTKRPRESLGSKAGKFALDDPQLAVISSGNVPDAAQLTRIPLGSAVADELRRSRIVREVVSQMQSAATECAGKITAATGLFPGLVFESLALHNDTPAEPLLPNIPLVLANGGPLGLYRRLRTLLHDRRRAERPAPEVLDTSAWAAAKKLAESIRCIIASLKHEDDVSEVTTCELSTPDPAGVVVSCGKVKHFLAQAHFAKLKSLYRGPDDEFTGRLFVLLQRYFNLGGCQSASVEGGWHGAVPARVLRAMRDELGVSGECFASPFNCAFTRYCSAFADTDWYFGSQGSFFALDLAGCVLEANPPFDHMVSVKMTTHMTRALDAVRDNDAPTGFVVVLPYSDDGRPLESLSQAVSALRGCGYLRAENTVPAADCEYIDGAQQFIVEPAGFVARLDTRIFVLQNEAAAKRWPAHVGLAAVVGIWSQPPTAATRARTESGAVCNA